MEVEPRALRLAVSLILGRDIGKDNERYGLSSAWIVGWIEIMALDGIDVAVSAVHSIRYSKTSIKLKELGMIPIQAAHGHRGPALVVPTELRDLSDRMEPR